MKIAVLDSATLGRDLDLSPLFELGEVDIYEGSTPSEVEQRICDCDVVIINKIKLGEHNLPYAKRLKLICLAATGYDNVDIDYCRRAGIAVCNVVGYSTQSVSQITLAMVLFLASHLGEHTEFVRNGAYTASGIANNLTPVYNELCGKRWGIVGYGNIGRQVGRVAEALGCEVSACRSRACEGFVSLEDICRDCDIITIHTPLSESTRGFIDERMISLMKPQAIVVNVARGAVWDEAAIARAVREGRIGALGCDVYSSEPFSKEHPFYDIKDMKNVCLTPHMAWGAYEARKRCLGEIIANIRAFAGGEVRSRVDLK